MADAFESLRNVPLELKVTHPWIPVVDGERPDIDPETQVDIKWSDGDVWNELQIKHCSLGRDSDSEYITHYRLHKPEQSLDDAFGLPVGVTPFVYPQTSFKPSSEAQLRADEAARVSSLLSEKLRTISDTVNKLTGKNFSVADIKLVKDLLESVEEYESGR
jgi:hypothetical protein